MTLDDVGNYRILLKVGMDESNPNPIKKYFYILVNNQIDFGNKEPGFEANLTPFFIKIGQK